MPLAAPDLRQMPFADWLVPCRYFKVVGSSSYVQCDSETLTQTSNFMFFADSINTLLSDISCFSFLLCGTEESIDPSGGMLCYLATVEECPLVDLC